MGRTLCTTHGPSDIVAVCPHISAAVLGGLAPPCYEEVSIIFDPPLDPAESAEENAVFFKTCLCDHCLIRAELEAHGQCVSEKVWGGRKEVFGGSRLDGTILHGSGAASFHAFLDDAA